MNDLFNSIFFIIQFSGLIIILTAIYIILPFWRIL